MVSLGHRKGSAAGINIKGVLNNLELADNELSLLGLDEVLEEGRKEWIQHKIRSSIAVLKDILQLVGSEDSH